MVLDECVAHPCGVDEPAEAMQRTLRWARARPRADAGRCDRRGVDGVTVTNPGQAQFGIVQGSVYPELREESAEGTVAIGFEAYAIGGLSVGEPTDVMYDIVSRTTPFLPGRPAALPDGDRDARRTSSNRWRAGIDLFDCVLPDPKRPERPALHQPRAASTSRTRATPKTSGRPIPTARATRAAPSAAPTCGIFFWPEKSARRSLNTLHNLNFYLDTMRRIRDAIVFGRFESFRLAFHQRLSRQAIDS